MIQNKQLFQFDYLYSNCISAKKTMAPKKKQSKPQRQSRHSPRVTAEIVAIQEHLIREDRSNDVPQILRRLETSYKNNKDSLPQSLLHLIVRLCGLGEIAPALTGLTSDQQIETFLEEIAQSKTKLSSQSLLPTLVSSPRQKFHSEFMKRISLFFNKLLSDDFQFMSEEQETNFLVKIRTWLGIFSKSNIRKLRFAAVQVMKTFIDCEVNQYNNFIKGKQSRKAFLFSEDVEKYLKTYIKDRVRDIDGKIRESIHVIIRLVFLNMEGDIDDENTLGELFFPLLKENNPKITETVLQTLHMLIKYSKYPKKGILPFIINSREQLQKISVIPNKNGNMSLKIQIQVNKLDKNADFLRPDHVSNIFEFYSIENYTAGLSTAIQAFYSSIYTQEQKLLNHRNQVLIEVINLLNNYESRTVKENIINQFFNYSAVACEQIFSMERLFKTILSGEYDYNNEQVQLTEKELIGWLEITQHFAKFIKKNIDKYEFIESDRSDHALAHWKHYSSAFNSSILGNIEEIYHERIEGKQRSVIYYLELIALVFLPIESAYENSYNFLTQKLLVLFESESEPTILKSIVDIFYNLKFTNISAMTKHLNQSPSLLLPETVIMKKISILNKFFVVDYVKLNFAQDIMHNFKKVSNAHTRIEYIIGLYCIHQWYLKEVMEGPLEEYKFVAYQKVQQEIIGFLINIINSGEHEKVKFSCANILCQMMTVISNDSLVGIHSLYFDVTVDDMLHIYRFLDRQYGLPKLIEQSEEDAELDTTRRFNNLDNPSLSVEKKIKMLFDLFENSIKVATFLPSIEIILGSLLQEVQSFDPDQTILKLNTTTDNNISMRGTYHNNFSVCAREKLATKYFDRLISKEIEITNINKFVFWKMVTEVLEVQLSLGIKERIINRLTDIYLRKKMTANQQKSSLNKALLFVLSEFEKVRSTEAYHELPLIQLILKKFARKVNKEAMGRVFAFFRSKYENIPNSTEETNKSVMNMVNFFQKTCKQVKSSKEEKQSDDQDEDSENDPVNRMQEVNEKNLMRPIQHGRETRSTSKRMDIEVQ